MDRVADRLRTRGLEHPEFDSRPLARHRFSCRQFQRRRIGGGTPPAAPAEAASANPTVSVARVPRAEAGGASTTIGNILLPERTYKVQPRQGFAEVRVRRAAKSAGDVRFSWWTEPASAIAGADFVAQGPVTESIAKGIRTASLFVKVLPNDSRKQSKLFYIDVSDLSGASTPPPVARIAVVVPAAHGT
jgi:hypothetical protein